MIKNRQYILALGDFAMLTLGLFSMILIRFAGSNLGAIMKEHMKVFFPLFILWILFFFIFDLYNIQCVNPNPRVIGRLGMAMLLSIIIGGFFFYLQPGISISPRTNLILTASIAFLFLILWRRICYVLFASVYSRKIMLVGASSPLSEIKDHIGKEAPLGRIVAEIASIEDLQKLQAIPLIDLVITDSISSQEIVLIEKKTHSRVLTMVDAYSELFAKIPLSLMTEEHALRIAIKARNYPYFFITRMGELFISILALIIFSPVIIIAGIAKKIEDGGPVFLNGHLRVGKDGKPFYLKKIRSMIATADKGGNQWTQKKDPRITPVGKIIRKLHIDEIPQLWNVIRGDMSLVGPRPEQPEFVSQLEKDIPFYYLRHVIKPGFTGWAQIKFQYARTISDSQLKFEYDLYYLENRSPLLDLGIIVKTIQIIFTH